MKARASSRLWLASRTKLICRPGERTGHGSKAGCRIPRGLRYSVYFAVGVATLLIRFRTAGGSYAAGVVATAFAGLRAHASGPGPRTGSHLGMSRQSGGDHGGPPGPASPGGRRAVSLTSILPIHGGIVGAWFCGQLSATGPFTNRKSTERRGARPTGAGGEPESHSHQGVGGAFLVEVILTALYSSFSSSWR